jgi:hypothetical protein
MCQASLLELDRADNNFVVVKAEWSPVPIRGAAVMSYGIWCVERSNRRMEIWH